MAGGRAARRAWLAAVALGLAACTLFADVEIPYGGPSRGRRDGSGDAAQDVPEDAADARETTDAPPDRTADPPTDERSPDIPREPDSGGGFDCASIPTAGNAGAVCVTEEACPDGICASIGAEPLGECYQICAPDVCTDACAPGAECVPVVDDAGDPVAFPDGTPQGVCYTPPPAGPYEACDVQDDCAPDLVCAAVADDATGTCFPLCNDAPCAPVDGYPALCTLTVGTDLACAVLCELDFPDCPDSLACVEVPGGAICVRP